jgi:hypothetical protein
LGACGKLCGKLREACGLPVDFLWITLGGFGVLRGRTHKNSQFYQPPNALILGLRATLRGVQRGSLRKNFEKVFDI